jgi:hypothetical protein
MRSMPSKVYARLGRAAALTGTGARLQVAPGRVRQLLAESGGLLLSCAAASTALLLLAAILGMALAHSLFPARVVLEIVLGLGAMIAGSGAYIKARSLVRWVEFRPAAAPTRAVVARMGRHRVVRVADLERVAVTEQLCLGERASLTVVLHTQHGADVVCSDGGAYGLFSPLKGVDATALTDWLNAVLEPVGVPVRYERLLKRAGLSERSWYPAQKVAQVWQIPLHTVPEITRLWSVPSEYYWTYMGPAYLGNRTKHGPVYDPNAVHEAAEHMRLGMAPPEQATAIGPETGDKIRDEIRDPHPEEPNASS